ncbi:hypothetical protein [Roseobacter sp.]|uniref:hypothetical protein n=1 Tax=Roseobacter sp. TaxID=1907202 RepID=UPI003859441E
MTNELDSRWLLEVGGSDTTMILPLLNGDAADFLHQQVEAAGGRIRQVFIMDAQGLNVAAISLTSDNWQGDEAKYSETYVRGADAVHFSEIEFDDSTITYQGQNP